MTLGGTFGFVLDNMFGSDEGFREYRWSSTDGMKYTTRVLRSSVHPSHVACAPVHVHVHVQPHCM